MDSKKESLVAFSLITLIFFSLLIANNSYGKKSLLLSLLLFIFLSRHRFNCLFKDLKSHLWMWAFQIWAALSCFWSFIFDKTFEIFTVQFSFFALCLLASSYMCGKEISDIFKRSIYLLVAVLACYLIIHPSGIFSGSGYQSIYPNKNHLGFTSAIGLLILIFGKNKKLFDYILVLFLLGLLIFSKSKTSLSLFLIILALTPMTFIIRDWILRIKDAFSKSLIIFAIKTTYILSYFMIFIGVIFRDEVAGFLINHLRDDFITGRGEIWRTVLMRSQSDLLVGIGPGVFWESGYKSEITQTFLYAKHPGWIENLVSADGGYIDIIGSLGFIGLALILCVFLSSIKQAMTLENSPSTKIAFSMLLFALGHNVTESDMYHSLNVVWFLIIFFSAYIAFLSQKDFPPQSSK